MTPLAVLSNAAPAPSPHLSQAIICNGMVYCSGQLGIHPQTRRIAAGAYAETRQALDNLKLVLEEAGTGPTNVVKATIFLSSMDHYVEVNKAYLEFFMSNPKPSRTCVAVAQLPLRGANVEIELIAKLPESAREPLSRF